MKILYAVQATGNGHIARAIELLPFLRKYGEVDVFLSGSNSSLHNELPVKFRSNGLSLFYGNKGKLDYWKIATSVSPIRILKEAKSLPVEQYDLVINDFETITSLACKLKNIPFVHFGHQASFASKQTPKPAKKDLMGEFILKHYASSPHNIGLHFESFDKDIYSPILKSTVLNATPIDEGHVTVYLSHYSDEVLLEQLSKVKDVCFHVFSKKTKAITKKDNIAFMPVNNKSFTESMTNAAGVITGAGFETPAECLYLNKKLLCLPILGQYEQLCNAEALKRFDVTIVNKIDASFHLQINNWMNAAKPKALTLNKTTAEIVELVIEKGLAIKPSNTLINELAHAQDLNFSLPNYSI